MNRKHQGGNLLHRVEEIDKLAVSICHCYIIYAGNRRQHPRVHTSIKFGTARTPKRAPIKNFISKPQEKRICRLL